MKKIAMYTLAAMMLAGTLSAAAYAPKNPSDSTTMHGMTTAPRPCPLSKPDC